MKNIDGFRKKKQQGKSITMVTCYDHWSAKLLSETDIDVLLVGDSVSMVVHGFESTVHADIQMMASHTAAVARAQTGKFILSDLPFLSHRSGKKHLMNHVDQLMKAGAHGLKLETQPGQEKWVRYLTESGVPVVGHIGLTPQYIHQMGGYKVQGKSQEQQEALLQQAKDLQEAGCHALVLECVPQGLAQNITFDLDIPTIGIGAGLQVDGQVLVLQDLLGLNPTFKPRFVRHFASGDQWFKKAVQNYTQEVTQKTFPRPEESF